MTDVKTCKLCKVEKPVDEFYVTYVSYERGRHAARCKECVKKKLKERYYAKKAKEVAS